jgi:Ser/Thr protein kinase RdoA (MazF antagonist)
VIPDELNVVLSRYPAIVRPTSAPEPLGNAGGGSGARLWRYASGRGAVVVRAWPPDGPGRPDLERIHRWLAEAGGLDFVPVPIPAMDGRTIREHAGLLWEVSPWHSGRADIGRPPPRPRLRAGLTALAAFHQVLARDRIRGQSPGLQARFHELNWLSMGGFEVLEGAIDRAPAEPGRASARQWLDLARRAAPRVLSSLRRASARVVALQPCLRDARPEHLLFTGEQVTGLVDFGAMAIECVAADLARLLAEWVGEDRSARADALDAYSAVRSLDDAESDLLKVFEDSADLLGGGHWVRWHFIEGRVFHDPDAILLGLERGVDRVARL